ncbi:UPF0182 family protein [Iningainema tapete]|uniref:UPF0182 protein ICL16_18545 n=1 Tax=Iningainema tapete BLCC-T55 TaxID=2748662 RepID=A0A8J7C821_9CYAN|nr:UPF0182 family protein [Iningainema tapete BLCC-T55]
MFWKLCFRLVIVLLGLWLIFDLVARLVVEIFWFQEVGYLQVFLLKLVTQGVLWVIAFGISAGYLLFNLTLAQRLEYQTVSGDLVRDERYSLDSSVPHQQSMWVSGEPSQSRLGNQILRPYRLNSLVPVVLALSLLIELTLFHYGQVALRYWHPSVMEPNVSPVLPTLFKLEVIWQLVKQLQTQIWYLGLLFGLAIALLIYPRFLFRVIAIVMSAIFGLILSGHWAYVLQYFHPTPFKESEPVFNSDISFYIFSLPIWELLEFWFWGLFLYSLLAVALTYLLSGNSLSEGNFRGFSLPQRRHIHGLAGCWMLVVALSYWISRYKLLYSPRGVAYGASYTDVRVDVPVYTALSLIAAAIATFLFWQMIFWQPKATNRRFLLYGLGVYTVMAVGAGSVLPTLVQRFIVQPNELALERPYIERSIALTRQAFDLEKIDARTFAPQGQLTYADIQANDLTIRNIRLWDQRPLLETNRQLQQIRPYYRFPDADIDRYTLQQNVSGEKPSAPEKQTQPARTSANVANTERQQTLIAARELDYSAVPQEAQTWVNKHLIYTHGYGFTLSPVNTVAPGGLPEYFIKDIGVSEGSSLSTSSPAIRASIPIGQPRIYYGEITNNYVMTGTLAKELDYPSGSDNVYNTYDGRGGINIGSFWRQCLFAKYLNDWQMLLTREFVPETKLLFRRNINQRIQAIAPFLQYDRDPYLVVADTQEGEQQQSYLYWIVDAYTTSDRYPYSDTGEEGINYIRNSVKVVIDAYHGTVNFYIADTRDPIIATWQRIFPEMFKPFSAMPMTLRSHIRYPVDLFTIQSERLKTYHMTDPQVFYNREDQWQIPNEVYGNKPQLVEPYYLITSLPTVPFEEFILLLPYTPRQRTNLIAWLAARADGENYGKLLLYQFPKQRLVYGPEQIEARINQDPIISQQISLWNRQGSRAIQGNLLVIPIEQSLLYVEPIYLEAEQNSLPTLVRVIVAYENRIVMAQTLEQALRTIFQEKEITAPPIVRPLEEPAQ